MTFFDISLTTLTPLHIGDGNELRLKFDIVARNKRTYRLNEDVILKAKADKLKQKPDGSYTLPGDLLDASDWGNKAFFRYVIPGYPRSKKPFAEAKSFIKDVHDCPYIPGSSLKGALRTALAWVGWKEQGIEIESIRDMQYHNKKRDKWLPKRAPADRYERVIFEPRNKIKNLDRRNPNLDLLRILQVSDCIGPKKSGQGLVLVNAQVLTKKGHGSPIEMEALKGGIKFNGTIKVDETLFDMPEAKKLGFTERKSLLDGLITHVNTHSQARLSELRTWFEEAEGCSGVAKTYQQIQDVPLQSNQALLQLGWGSGWDGKTFGTRLQADIYLFEEIIKTFRMHKQQKDAPPRKPGDPFPRSKRAVMKIDGNEAEALVPFGWLLFEMNKAS